ncbi:MULTISPECIES: DMT family transporter [unclassified Oleiphilus]|uniref:DMT family transporter n=1 Tax=unclassified Oleiphilus TaxID=2631174 RepID=UPI0007C2813E|nr:MULTISPECIES: DMT family transporter [unclassified Oleiphilus]KZY64888.1 hypothetical protein A3738_09885 [Oleiphilus sp. HI0066]KZY68734.1 hypothetical protein A3739_10580 [Oleiphilus sp. HI0067]MCH2160003.1 DMT family transporter [Oleiphilaceae bacterium]
MNTALTMRLKDWAILIGLSVLWGGSFLFNEFTLPDFSPTTTTWLRVTIAAACLWTLAFVRKVPIPSSPRFWVAIALMGLLNNAIPFSLIVWGQQEIDSGLASILNATTPLFTILVAGIFLSDERISPTKLSGVVFGFVGVVIMIGTDQITQINTSISPSTLAQFAILGAALCYAIATVFGRRFKAMNVNVIVIAAAQTSLASLWLIPVCISFDGFSELQVATHTAWLAVLALGVLSTALAYIGYFAVLSSAGATNLSLVTFMVPVSAIFLGWLIIGEQLSTSHYLGMLCIALGLGTIDGRPLKAIRTKMLKP